MPCTIWMAGDVNTPNIDRQMLTIDCASEHNSLLAITCDYGLTKIVTEPTRLHWTYFY